MFKPIKLLIAVTIIIIFIITYSILGNRYQYTNNNPLSTIEKDLTMNNQDEQQAIKFMSDIIKLTNQNKLDWQFYFDEGFNTAVYKCNPTENSEVTIYCKENASHNSVKALITSDTRTTEIDINLPIKYRKDTIPKFANYLKKKYGKETEMQFKSERTGDDITIVQFNNLVNTISEKASTK